MKVSREQMAQNRQLILDEASRLFRERGFDAVTVADVMKAAGQTHGGFYGHFKSKDALIAAAVAHSLSGEAAGMADLQAWMDAYLSPLHLDHPEQGCPAASMAGLLRLQAPEARRAMRCGFEAQIERLADALPGDDAARRRRAAFGQWSAMVGAIVLARAVDDTDLANEVLRETRAWLDSVSSASERASKGKITA